MKKLLFIWSVSCLLLCGCSKESQKNIQPIKSVRIHLLSGDNQTSPEGIALNDSIVVKITKDGNPLSKCIVEFTGSGCNSDLTVQVITDANGIAKYLWRLAANQGAQTLNAVALDGIQKMDSITVHAIALAQNDDAVSACIPYNMPAINIVRLTTGRLLACFQGRTSLRYSDDNAISWNPVKGFGNSHYIVAVVTTPQNEIFAATYGDGIYYSKDGGTNWADITPPTFNKAELPTDMAYTADGTLLFTGHTNTIFISHDKGKTWTNSSAGLAPNFSYFFPCKTNNGDFYMINFNYVLYKSVDGGATWLAQNTTSSAISAICVDNNGWFYKSSFTNSDGYTTVYISKDNAKSFTPLYQIRDFLSNMSILQDGHFYFSDSFNISEVFDNHNIFQLVNSRNNYINSRSYLFNKNKLIFIDNGFIKRGSSH